MTTEPILEIMNQEAQLLEEVVRLKMQKKADDRTIQTQQVEIDRKQMQIDNIRAKYQEWEKANELKTTKREEKYRDLKLKERELIGKVRKNEKLVKKFEREKIKNDCLLKEEKQKNFTLTRELREKIRKIKKHKQKQNVLNNRQLKLVQQQVEFTQQL